MICSSQTVQLVSHCFTTRTSRTGRELVYTPHVHVMICSSQTVRLVSHCFTTRTSRMGRGLVYTPQVPLMICSSQTVRVVNQCFTTRTSRTSRTGHGIVYIYTPRPSNDMQFTNCTSRKPIFHDPYESYGSWTCIYTPSFCNDMQFTNCTTRKQSINQLNQSINFI